MTSKDHAMLAAESIQLQYFVVDDVQDPTEESPERIAEIIRDYCDTSAPMWIERAADLLGCDPFGPSVVTRIKSLLAERERQRRTVASLRGQLAKNRHSESVTTAPRSASGERNLTI